MFECFKCFRVPSHRFFRVIITELLCFRTQVLGPLLIRSIYTLVDIGTLFSNGFWVPDILFGCDPECCFEFLYVFSPN